MTFFTFGAGYFKITSGGDDKMLSDQDIKNGISGTFICPDATTKSCEIRRNITLKISANGKIDTLENSLDDTPSNTVWLPGFVDTHVHFPQHRVRGRSSGTLLKWLKETIFPEEMKFVEPRYATQVAAEFCTALLQAGTTCAQIYSSSDEGATDILFQALFDAGIRGQAGMTLMDRDAPKELCVSAHEAEPAIRRLVSKWHGLDEDRLQYVITPRFALSCSRELLSLSGRLSRELGLSVQTHLSENTDEISAVKETFPDCDDYLSVYEKYGLAHDRSLFAHCIHLSDQEWSRIEHRNCSISHCPDSNFFLGSGLFPWRKLNAYEVRLGLGSDVGAGRTYAMNDIASSAYDVALNTASDQTPAALLWYATRGGALAVGRNEIGVLEPSYECDLIGIDVPGAKSMNDAEIYDALLFRKNECRVHTAIVRGKLVYQR